MNGFIRPFQAAANSVVTFDLSALAIKNCSVAVYYYNGSHSVPLTKLFSTEGVGDITLTATIPSTLADGHKLVLPIGVSSGDYGAAGLYVLAAEGTVLEAKARLMLLGSPKEWADGNFALGEMKLTGGDWRGTVPGGLLHLIPDGVFGTTSVKMGSGQGTLVPRMVLFCRTRTGVLPSPKLTGPIFVQRGKRMISAMGVWQDIGGEPIGVFDVSTLADETDPNVWVTASQESVGPSSVVLQDRWSTLVTELTSSPVSVFFLADAEPPLPALSVELVVSGNGLSGSIGGS